MFSFEADVDRVTHAPGELVQVLARLQGDVAGLAVGTVTARLADSSGATVATVSLLDDGLHGDGAAGDRVYGGLSTAPGSAGRYGVVVEMTGTYGGVAMTRASRAAFDVLGGGFTGSITDAAADADGDGVSDVIAVTVGVNATAGQALVVSADLEDAAGYPIGHAVEAVSPAVTGLLAVPLTFDLSAAGCGQFSGALALRSLRLALPEEGYRVLDERAGPVAISAYDGEQFGCGTNPEPNPTISILSPDRAVVGDSATIEVSGSGFAQGVTVAFGNTTAGVVVERVSSELLRVAWTIPAAHPLGAL